MPVMTASRPCPGSEGPGPGRAFIVLSGFRRLTQMADAPSPSGRRLPSEGCLARDPRPIRGHRRGPPPRSSGRDRCRTCRSPAAGPSDYLRLIAYPRAPVAPQWDRRVAGAVGIIEGRAEPPLPIDRGQRRSTALVAGGPGVNEPMYARLARDRRSDREPPTAATSSSRRP